MRRGQLDIVVQLDLELPEEMQEEEGEFVAPRRHRDEKRVGCDEQAAMLVALEYGLAARSNERDLMALPHALCHCRRCGG